MENQPRYLVAGADSMIGRALVQGMKRARIQVTGTTRRRDSVSDTTLFLDLAASPDSWHLPQNVDVAIICAGVTRIQACKNDPAASARVNVEGVVSLARRLHRGGAFVVYLSTNQVFDGSVPFRLTDDPLSPVTEYGRQKAQAEQQMRKEGTVDSIVRLTKVLGPQDLLFRSWAQALLAGRAIEAFSDMTLAPVPLSCVVSVLLLIASGRYPGTFHLSGERDLSYEAAAQIGARVLGASLSLVQPASVLRANPQGEPAPACTTLNADVLKSTVGVVPPDVSWTIETAYLNPQLLAGV